jgi:hypothetical protein
VTQLTQHEAVLSGKQISVAYLPGFMFSFELSRLEAHLLWVDFSTDCPKEKKIGFKNEKINVLLTVSNKKIVSKSIPVTGRRGL